MGRFVGPGRGTPAGVCRRALCTTAILVALAGCSGGSGAGRPPATAGAAAGAASVPPGATPAASPEEAVAALLAAEQAGDHTVSFRLVSSTGRQDLDQAAWTRRRSEVPAVTGFAIERVDGATVVARVEHEPGLDPFVGLRPGVERQTWQARQEGGGWLVDPEPVVEPEYPPVPQAREAALAWAQAVQACDEGAATGHQAVDVLFGRPEVAAGLCGAPAALVAGPPGPAPAGPGTADLVAQFGPETLSWAQVVPITGSPRPFSVVLAPIGSVWKVAAVLG